MTASSHHTWRTETRSKIFHHRCSIHLGTACHIITAASERFMAQLKTGGEGTGNLRERCTFFCAQAGYFCSPYYCYILD